MFRIGTALVVILAIGAGLVIGTLNSTPVSMDLLWVQLNWPLGLLVMLFFSIGLLLGIGGCYLFQILPLRMKLRKQHRQTETVIEETVIPVDD